MQPITIWTWSRANQIPMKYHTHLLYFHRESQMKQKLTQEILSFLSESWGKIQLYNYEKIVEFLFDNIIVLFVLFCCYAHIFVRSFYSLFRFCLQLFCLLVREHSLQVGLGNLKRQGWLYNSVIKSSSFSLRRYRLYSKHLYSSSQYSITPVPMD